MAFVFAVGPDPGLEIGSESRFGSNFQKKNSGPAAGQGRGALIKRNQRAACPAGFGADPARGCPARKKNTHSGIRVYSRFFFQNLFLKYYFYIKKFKKIKKNKIIFKK